MIELKLMQPTAIAYIALFAVTALLYYLVPDKTFSGGRHPVNLRNVWLLIACIIFIGISDIRFAAVAMAAAVFTYGSGRLIGSSGAMAKAVLAIHIAGILALVVVLRYFAAQTRLMESGLNEGIVVPVGIMIYSLKAISYTAGIYRGEVRGDTSFLDCLLYLLFFPVLMVGPIEEPESFTAKLHQKHPLRFENLQQGFLLILWGFLLKLVLADNIAVFADRVFKDDFKGISGAIVLVTALLLTIQIYATFYGLSAVAAGYSRILGFEIPDNFTAPFLAPSMRSFRKGWNATLNSWNEKNIYEPLTSIRAKDEREHRLYNVFCLLLMTLFIGLWYGKATHYLVGAIGLGLYEIIESALICRPRRNGNGVAADRGLPRAIMTAVRFAVVTIACMFFRSRRLSLVLLAVRKILTAFKAGTLHNGTFFKMGFWPRYWVLIIAGIAVLLIADICKNRGVVLHKWISQRFFIIRWAAYISAFVIILIFGCWGFGYHQPHVLCNFLY